MVSPRFAYLYFMKDEPDRIRATVPRHVAHWQQLRLPGYLGGPFEDRTGGLITFQAEDGERARRAVDTRSVPAGGAAGGALAQAMDPPVSATRWPPGRDLRALLGWSGRPGRGFVPGGQRWW